jgi:hypothetical protein
VPSATGGRQRTVAMWIAAALAAGMAGFFVLARVDEKAGGGGASSPPVRTDRAVPAGGAVSSESRAGGGGAEVSQSTEVVPTPQQPVPVVDAGVALAVETVPDAGTKRVGTKKKLVKTRPAPKNVNSNPAPVKPPIKQQAYDQDAPEEPVDDRPAE